MCNEESGSVGTPVGCSTACCRSRRRGAAEEGRSDRVFRGHDPAHPGAALEVEEVLPIGRALRLTVRSREARDANGFDPANVLARADRVIK
jgi:hypothetical protein